VHLFLCVDCESPHFLVRWNEASHIWTVACEGCGAIYRLIPTGTAEVLMKGIDQS
jgi:hypothetical protein